MQPLLIKRKQISFPQTWKGDLFSLGHTREKANQEKTTLFLALQAREVDKRVNPFFLRKKGFFVH